MPFVGRAAELEKLHGWLRSERSCIAVTGIGGIGKTFLVEEFVSREESGYGVEAVYVSLKGEEEKIRPIRIVMDGVGKGLGKKVAEWFERRWMEIEELSSSVVGVKKEVKEKAEKSLKEILSEADSRLEGEKRIVVLDDLQVVEKESLRFICELATVNWKNLRWILIHRSWKEISEGLKDLSGWSSLRLGGLNEDNIKELFLEHSEGIIRVKKINKKAFHEATNGYPNWVETIVHALKEEYNGREIWITRGFIKKNYDIFTKPMEYVLDNYFDNEDKTALLCVAIFKEDATIGEIVSTFRLTLDYFKKILKYLEVEIGSEKLRKLERFGFIEINQEEFEIHDAKRDRIIEILSRENEENARKVRETAMNSHFAIAESFLEKQDYMRESLARIHQLHHASSINPETALESLICTSRSFHNCGDYFSAYICSKHALEKIQESEERNESLNLLKLEVSAMQSFALFKRGIFQFFKFSMNELLEEATKAFIYLKKAREEVRKKAFEYYIETINNTMFYFGNESMASELLKLLRKVPLKGEEMAQLKTTAAELLTILSDSRAKKLLEEVGTFECAKAQSAYVRGLWRMDNFDEASKMFEKAAKKQAKYRLEKSSAVNIYCCAAILASDEERASKMLANAKKNLVLGDVDTSLNYEFTDAFLSVNRRKKANRLLKKLLKMPITRLQKNRYLANFLTAFILLDLLEGLSIDEEAKKIIEEKPLCKIMLGLDDKEKALKILDRSKLFPLYKNILKKIIIQGNKNKMSKYIAFYYLTMV